jgi:hypothetical protein
MTAVKEEAGADVKSKLSARRCRGADIWPICNIKNLVFDINRFYIIITDNFSSQLFIYLFYRFVCWNCGII